MWAYRSKGVSIFPDDLPPLFRPNTLGSPATSGVINPAKTRLYETSVEAAARVPSLPHRLFFNYSRLFF